jgi:hypothetical protein
MLNRLTQKQGVSEGLRDCFVWGLGGFLTWGLILGLVCMAVKVLTSTPAGSALLCRLIWG